MTLERASSGFERHPYDTGMGDERPPRRHHPTEPAVAEPDPLIAPSDDPLEPTRPAWRPAAVAVAVVVLVLGGIFWLVGSPPKPPAGLARLAATVEPHPARAVAAIVPTGESAYVINAAAAAGWSGSVARELHQRHHGAGVLVTFPGRLAPDKLWIFSQAAGSQVEVRTAPADRRTLDGTRVLGSASLDSGMTVIPLEAVSASSLLLWVDGHDGHAQDPGPVITAMGVTS